ncbi:MAG TPA: hypothetical protein VFV01_01690 [Spirillospora sp.]|nr:hypothetical protein [Spirillospora sp.]
MDTATLKAAVTYFPLLGRPRPPCPALPARIQEITDIAHTARRKSAGAMHDAAHALNKAALVVSDCGRPDIARQLCRQHLDVYMAADKPLTFSRARFMLEPVVNLARLHIRGDDPESALRILKAMHHAAVCGTDMFVDGRALPLAHLTGTHSERTKLREWVWLQLLTDGLRSLVRAGRWTEALALAEAHRGIGAHLMEGRQVAILTAGLNGDSRAALDLLHASSVTQPWEHQVASCLEVMCGDPDDPNSPSAVASMVHAFQASRPIAGYAVFRARLGLTVTLLSCTDTSHSVRTLLTQVADEAIAAADGYAAREVLDHSIPGVAVPAERHRALEHLAAASGLGAGSIPQPLQDALNAAIGIAAEALAHSLKEQAPSP